LPASQQRQRWQQQPQQQQQQQSGAQYEEVGWEYAKEDGVFAAGEERVEVQA
jgi:hypothetical protein